MNIIKAYTTGIKTSLRWPKMIFVVYAVNLILGLSLALPFFFSFRSALGNSMTAENLLNSLDYSTIRELFNNNSFVSLFSQMRWTVLLYWLVSVFLVGGIIRTYYREEFNASTFFSGAGVNFLRFLASDVILFALMVISIAVIAGLTVLIASLFNNIITEKPLFWLGGVALFLIICTVVLFLMISDYAKFYMEMSNTYRVIKAIRKAFGYVFGNFVRTYFLYFLLMVIPILVIILYHYTLEKVGMKTVFGIIIMFFVQQAFILLRVWFRLWFLASEFELYADDYTQTIEIEIPDYKLNKTVETNTLETETAIITASENEKDNLQKNTTINISTQETEQSNKADVIKIEIDENSGDVVINNSGDTFNYEAAENISKETNEQKEDSSKVVSGSYYVENQESETKQESVATENSTEETNEQKEDSSKVVSGSYYVDEQKYENQDSNNAETEITDNQQIIKEESPEQEIVETINNNSEEIDEEEIENPYEQAIAALENSNTEQDNNETENYVRNQPDDETIIYDEDGDGIDDSANWGMSNTLGFVDEEDTETEDNENEPKVIKIYSEEQMKEIAKKQQIEAGLSPDQELTEVVSESIEDGIANPNPEPEDAYSQEIEDDNTPAKG